MNTWRWGTQITSNYYKGNRFTKGNDTSQPFNTLFDQDLKLVKEQFLNNFTKNCKNIDNTHVKVKENLNRTPYENIPIHIKFDVGLPITLH